MAAQRAGGLGRPRSSSLVSGFQARCQQRGGSSAPPDGVLVRIGKRLPKPGDFLITSPRLFFFVPGCIEAAESLFSVGQRNKPDDFLTSRNRSCLIDGLLKEILRALRLPGSGAELAGQDQLLH